MACKVLDCYCVQFKGLKHHVTMCILLLSSLEDDAFRKIF